MKPENEWKAPSSRFLDQELQPGAEEAEGKESNEKKQPTGEIVAIIKRAWRPYCGVIEAPSGIGVAQALEVENLKMANKSIQKSPL